MKRTIALHVLFSYTLFVAPSISAFSVGSRSAVVRTNKWALRAETTSVVNEASSFGSTLPEDSSYEKIGVDREQLALGVDPEEFLKYIGT
jgi:hypothetical protein